MDSRNLIDLQKRKAIIQTRIFAQNPEEKIKKIKEYYENLIKQIQSQQQYPVSTQKVVIYKTPAPEITLQTPSIDTNPNVNIDIIKPENYVNLAVRKAQQEATKKFVEQKLSQIEEAIKQQEPTPLDNVIQTGQQIFSSFLDTANKVAQKIIEFFKI